MAFSKLFSQDLILVNPEGEAVRYANLFSDSLPMATFLGKSDANGKFYNAQKLKSLYIRHIGYQGEQVELDIQKSNNIVVLKPKIHKTTTVVIRPFSFDSLVEKIYNRLPVNYIPNDFYQKGLAHEEYLANNRYLKLLQYNFHIHQYRMDSNLHDKKFQTKSTLQLLTAQSYYDTSLIQDFDRILGKIISQGIDVRSISSHGVIKGVNILDWMYYIYKKYRDKSSSAFIYADTIQGRPVEYYKISTQVDGVDFEVEIAVDVLDTALISYNVKPHKELNLKDFIDFKTKALLFLLGIKVEIQPFYFQMNFQKSQGRYIAKDFVAHFPFIVTRRKKTIEFAGVIKSIYSSQIYQPALKGDFKKSNKLILNDSSQFILDKNFGNEFPYIKLNDLQRKRVKF
ncbi:MAG: hypothetical protein MUE53_04330 [Chitinophagales bacterium]|nr:hypothetical protein [Chitinophagales bacterium]